MLRMRWIGVWLVVVLVLPGYMVKGQEEAALPAQRAADLQASLQAVLLDAELPGLVVWLESPQGDFSSAAGFADMADAVPMQPDAAFRIGGITQMFTAALTVMLAEEGRLALDDPLSRWLPEIAARLPYGGQITLRELLNHTSGIADYGTSQWFQASLTGRRPKRWTPQTVIDELVIRETPEFAPGAAGRWAYSSTNYLLLGMVIEKAAGSSYAQALRQRILDPLGLTSTFLPGEAPASLNLAHGYMHLLLGRSQIDVTDMDLAWAWSASGVLSNAPDLAAFARALFSGVLFADSQSLAEMLDFVEMEGAPGYHLGIQALGSGLYGHVGNAPGYLSLLLYAPQYDGVLVIWTNSSRESLETFLPIMQAAIRAMRGR